MEQHHEYIQTYLEKLPPELRPDTINEKVLEPLRQAWKNNWDASDLAKAVASANFSTSTSPAGSAIYRLTQIAKQKAYKSNSIGKYQPPAPTRQLTREQKLERMALVKKLIDEKIGSEDAEKLMSELVEKQTKQN
jgi:hypothetical protein